MTTDELQMAMSKLIQIGDIVDVDYAKKRVRVQLAGLKTAWLRWGVQRAGGDVTWWAPEKGEQVLVMFPYGDESQGVVMCALYSDEITAPSDSADKQIIKFKDGSTVEYDRTAHHMKINSVGSVEISGATTLSVNFEGSIEVTAPTTTITTNQTHNGNVNIEGNLSVSGLTTTGGLASMGTAGGAGATINGSINVTDGDVSADGVSLKGHAHSGDSGGTTGSAQ